MKNNIVAWIEYPGGGGGVIRYSDLAEASTYPDKCHFGRIWEICIKQGKFSRVQDTFMFFVLISDEMGDKYLVHTVK